MEVSDRPPPEMPPDATVPRNMRTSHTHIPEQCFPFVPPAACRPPDGARPQLPAGVRSSSGPSMTAWRRVARFPATMGSAAASDRKETVPSTAIPMGTPRPVCVDLPDSRQAAEDHAFSYPWLGKFGGAVREVRVALHIPGGQPRKVFDSLSDFASFPQHSDVVHSVSLADGPDHDRISTWEVDFAGGILKWRERDRLDKPRLRIDFELVDGDLHALSGGWSIAQLPEGSTVRFGARFDLGVPGMADLLEPVAGRAMTDTVTKMLHGVFGPDAEVTECQDRSVAPLEGCGDQP
ncbi:type II toxin-antitoxin system RatA family toxin [Streptomyces yunnanensis]|uniref:type II toxin-antitoxin system RatA family toxin n=2 Tax=Streptomyces TaxID=1883 RepID=UPI0009A11111